MYNTQPHISTHEVSVSAKNGASGSHLENGLGRWVQPALWAMAVMNG